MTDHVPPRAILDVLARLLGRLCEQDDPSLSPDMLLEDIPGIDSLRLLQAVALLEEHFQVEIDVVALNDLYRVQDILDAISKARPMPVAIDPPNG